MRFLTFLALLMIAPLLAGAYGAIHDQISYTISQEYFTKFKYIQFGLENADLPNRVKASLIGFLATWWMGLPIGLLVGLCGFRHQPAKTMLFRTLKAYMVVLIVTMLVGLGGLCYGWFFADHNVANYPNWYIPNDLLQPRHYLSVGYLHNYGYLGGLIGLIAGVAFQFLQRPYDLRASMGQ